MGLNNKQSKFLKGTKVALTYYKKNIKHVLNAHINDTLKKMGVSVKKETLCGNKGLKIK